MRLYPSTPAEHTISSALLRPSHYNEDASGSQERRGSANGHLAVCLSAPDCGVQYAPSTGYFIAPNSGHAESHMTRRVMCPRDGQPMYLTDTNPEKRAFRLWRCPQCDSTRTNEEDLMNKMA
jgi:hypothetical protein